MKTTSSGTTWDPFPRPLDFELIITTLQHSNELASTRNYAEIMASTRTSFLSPTQRYAAGSLFAMALHQAQIHQTRPLSFSLEEDPTEGKRISNGSSSRASVSEDPDLWVHENSALLRPVFRS